MSSLLSFAVPAWPGWPEYPLPYLSSAAMPIPVPCDRTSVCLKFTGTAQTGAGTP
jgi:hypothetical protein